MKYVDTLLVKAQVAARKKAERLFMAFVYPEGDMWVARVHLWNGTKKNGLRYIFEKLISKEKAIAAIHKMAVEYPPTEDIPIIVDDMEPDRAKRWLEGKH